MQVTIPEASRRLSELIRSAQTGVDVVIVEHGAPVARLVSANHSTANTAETGRASTILSWLARHPMSAEVCRSAEEIDTAIEAERAGWE